MFHPISIYIGLRYTRAKKQNHFVSFISLVSMAGIALGVTVLITVLSVMNGFDHQIKNRIFSMVPQVTVSNSGGISNWQSVEKQIYSTSKAVVAVAPFISGQGMLSHVGESSGVYVNGILPSKENIVSSIQSKMIDGSVSSLKPGSFGIVIGVDLAMRLGLSVGDKVLLITPQSSPTPIGVVPRLKRFKVVGVFKADSGFGFDAGVTFINLSDAQTLFKLGNSVSGLKVKVNDLYDAPMLRVALSGTLPPQYVVNDWTNEYGALFKAIKMEKTMIFVILLFIVAVATFNLVSTLVMTVTDKRSDIAILRTLGATPTTIMKIFMFQGGVIGLIGTLFGVIGGVLLAIHVTQIVTFIEHYLSVHFISSSIYFIDYLPSQLNIIDVVRIASIALIMSLLATIYPAWHASRTKPAEALRYE